MGKGKIPRLVLDIEEEKIEEKERGRRVKRKGEEKRKRRKIAKRREVRQKRRLFL